LDVELKLKRRGVLKSEGHRTRLLQRCQEQRMRRIVIKRSLVHGIECVRCPSAAGFKSGVTGCVVPGQTISRSDRDGFFVTLLSAILAMVNIEHGEHEALHCDRFHGTALHKGEFVAAGCVTLLGDRSKVTVDTVLYRQRILIPLGNRYYKVDFKVSIKRLLTSRGYVLVTQFLVS